MSDQASRGPGHLEPLTCVGCAAPVPVGDQRSFACPFCATTVDVPAEYQLLRDSALADTAARAQSAEMFAALGGRPSVIARLLVRSLGVLLVIAGMLAPLPAILIFLFIHFGGTPFGLQLYDVLSDAQQTGLMIAVPLVLLAVGWLIAGAARRWAIDVGVLKASLAARPPARSGGRALCRVCGAALDYGPEDLGARCLYCHSDNLLRMPRAYLERMERYLAGLLVVGDAYRRFLDEKARHRRRLLWRSIPAGVALAVPVLIVWRGCGPPADESRDWQASLLSRRWMPSPAVSVSLEQPCEGRNRVPLVFAAAECESGCVKRVAMPLRRGERIRAVAGELRSPVTVRIDRHVMSWFGSTDPREHSWGEVMARLRLRPGKPAAYRVPTSGWWRADIEMADAAPGGGHDVCIDIGRPD